MRQHQVLLVGDADLAHGYSASARSAIAPSARPCASPGVLAVGFSEIVDDGVAGHLVRRALLPAPSGRNAGSALARARTPPASPAASRRPGGAKCGADAGQLGVGQIEPWPSICAHSASTWRANSSDAQLVHQDLDARLVDVVAAAVAVVDAQDRLEIGEQSRPGRKSRISLADHRACGPGRRRP